MRIEHVRRMKIRFFSGPRWGTLQFFVENRPIPDVRFPPSTMRPTTTTRGPQRRTRKRRWSTNRRFVLAGSRSENETKKARDPQRWRSAFRDRTARLPCRRSGCEISVSRPANVDVKFSNVIIDDRPFTHATVIPGVRRETRPRERVSTTVSNPNSAPV